MRRVPSESDDLTDPMIHQGSTATPVWQSNDAGDEAEVRSTSTSQTWLAIGQSQGQNEFEPNFSSSAVSQPQENVHDEEVARPDFSKESSQSHRNRYHTGHWNHSIYVARRRQADGGSLVRSSSCFRKIAMPSDL